MMRGWYCRPVLKPTDWGWTGNGATIFTIHCTRLLPARPPATTVILERSIILAKTISNGWYYDGIYAPHRERRHGNSPRKLSPEQFVVCIQNHDQVAIARLAIALVS